MALLKVCKFLFLKSTIYLLYIQEHPQICYAMLMQGIKLRIALRIMNSITSGSHPSRPPAISNL